MKSSILQVLMRFPKQESICRIIKSQEVKTTGEVKIKVKMLSGLNTGKDLILTITLMLLMEKNLRTRVQLI